MIVTNNVYFKSTISKMHVLLFKRDWSKDWLPAWLVVCLAGKLTPMTVIKLDSTYTQEIFFLSCMVHKLLNKDRVNDGSEEGVVVCKFYLWEHKPL